MKQFLILIVLWTAGGVSAADDTAALKLRIDALEKDVAALKAENEKLREGLAAQQSEYSKQVYVNHVVPLVRPMLKDFGMDESLIVPVDKIENLADAYRPLLMLIQKLGAVADLGPPASK
jgi:regulator of replication initiation timing